jgi:hypothetical protein
MLEWLGRSGQELVSAFPPVFGTVGRPFGKRSTWIGGLSDGAAGVQWNAGYDPRDRRQWVGVNLEGMKYDGWPVARLIERELQHPTLAALITQLDDAAQIELLWRRDYWQATGRPPILEQDIPPTPVNLDRLSERAWIKALTEAQACLDETKNHRARASQLVTLMGSGRRVEGQVSPHLTLILSAETPRPWHDFLQESKERMHPLHHWVAARSQI